jgi:hypothetical protein
MVGESLGDLFVTTASDNANEISGLNPILQNLNNSAVPLDPMSIRRVPCDRKETLVPIHLREPFSALLVSEDRKVFVTISFVSLPREQVHLVPQRLHHVAELATLTLIGVRLKLQRRIRMRQGNYPKRFLIHRHPKDRIGTSLV